MLPLFGGSPGPAGDFENQLQSAPDNDGFWELVRAQFPVTAHKSYMNCGTSGPSPLPVLAKVRQTLEQLAASGEYGGWETARTSLARFVDVADEEICLTHNTTEGINIVAGGLPLKAGDEVVMTSHEHAGNALPWLNMAKLKGIVIKVFEPQSTAAGNLERIASLLNPKTRVVAVPHITCTAGHVLPVKDISALCRDKGVWSFVDGAHGTGMMPLSLRELGCDFYASCCHKWLLAPAGTGYLYVREGLLDTLSPYFLGALADSGWEVSLERQTLQGYAPSASRYDYGTQSSVLYQGVVAATAFMDMLGMEKIWAHSSGLAGRLQQKLLALDGKVEMLTPTEDVSRAAMVGFRVKGRNYRELGNAVSAANFRIRLVPESGLDALRVSTHIMNTPEEVDRLAELVRQF